MKKSREIVKTVSKPKSHIKRILFELEIKASIPIKLTHFHLLNATQQEKCYGPRSGPFHA